MPAAISAPKTQPHRHALAGLCEAQAGGPGDPDYPGGDYAVTASVPGFADRLAGIPRFAAERRPEDDAV